MRTTAFVSALIAAASLAATVSSPASAQQDLNAAIAQSVRANNLFTPMKCGWVRQSTSHPYVALFGPYRTVVPPDLVEESWPGTGGICMTAGRQVSCPQAAPTGPYSYCTQSYPHGTGFSGSCNGQWVDITSAVQMRADAGSTWQARCNPSSTGIEVRYGYTNPRMSMQLIRGDTRARPVAYSMDVIDHSDPSPHAGFDPGTSIPVAPGGWLYTGYQYRGSNFFHGAEAQAWKLYFTRSGCSLAVRTYSGGEGEYRLSVFHLDYGTRTVQIC